MVYRYRKILGGMLIPENIEWDADAGNIGLDSDDGKREVVFGYQNTLCGMKMPCKSTKYIRQRGFLLHGVSISIF